MTTKEIAEAAGVSPDTVIRKIREIYPEKLSAKRRTELSQKEAIAVMAELRKKNFVELPQNASVLPQSAPVFAKEELAAIVKEIMIATVPAIIAIVRGVIPQEAVALPAPADLSYRDQLRRVIASYAKASGDHSGAWRELYSQFYYRYHRNLRECAKNRGLDTLDYVEQEGLLPELLSLAIFMYGAAAA